MAPRQVERWFKDHQEKGTSARNIRYARAVLRAALNQARKWRMVNIDAAELVDPPRHVAKEIRPLTPEPIDELARFLLLVGRRSPVIQAYRILVAATSRTIAGRRASLSPIGEAHVR